MSLGTSVFSKSDDGEDEGKKERDETSLAPSNNQSESKTAMIDKLLLDIVTVKDSVVPPTAVDAKYDDALSDKKSISIASGSSSSSGLS